MEILCLHPVVLTPLHKIHFRFDFPLNIKQDTLVSQIIVQQTLLDFKNFPTSTSLFQPAFLSNFEILKQKTMIHSNKISKIPTCMALFQPALLSIFEILPTFTFIQSFTFICETKVQHVTQKTFSFLITVSTPLERCS